MRRSIIAAILMATTPLTLAPPAHAIFGVGDIVIDPTNLAQKYSDGGALIGADQQSNSATS